MDQDSRAIALFDAVGRSLQIRADVWGKALGAAMAQGWRPAGTAPPPRRWRADRLRPAQERWDGRYEEPVGQCVTAADAERFAQALSRALEVEPDVEAAGLAGFAARGSFLVCPLSTELRRALETLPPGLACGGPPERDAASLLRLLEHLEAAGPDKPGVPADQHVTERR